MSEPGSRHTFIRPPTPDNEPHPGAGRAAPRVRPPAPVFCPYDPAEAALLEKLPDFLAEVFPMSAAGRQHLAHNVALLSESLTSRRGRLADRSYWASPGLSGAYLSYFLPWNLIRLMGILPGLKLDLAPGSKILDLGSGPLALPLALWLSRPDLRKLPLCFTCLDSAALPLRLGRALFRALAGTDSAWRFTVASEPLFRALPGLERDFSLLTACNMLNELKPERGSTLASHWSRQMEGFARRLKPGGQMLIVEPGNRLGGKIIAAIRAAALQRGFAVPAPCPHQEACPLSSPARPAGAGRPPVSWCHFARAKEDVLAPAWLDKLSREARLAKDKLALSWLFLEKDKSGKRCPRRGGNADVNLKAHNGPATLPGRVVSNPLLLPGREGHFFYVCSGRGLVLLQTSRNLRSGQGVTLFFSGKEEKDARSGAVIVSGRLEL